MHLCFDILDRLRRAALKGVLAVAPGAAQVADSGANENARQPREGRFTLERFVDFDDLHEKSGSAAELLSFSVKKFLAQQLSS
jgi:hypothetical protein